MAENYEDQVKWLIDEVVDWTERNQLFPMTGPMTDRLRTSIPYSIRRTEDWFAAIDASNEESPHCELSDLLSNVESAYRMIHQFGAEHLVEYVSRATESIGQLVNTSARVQDVAAILFRVNTMDMEWEESLDHVCTTIANQLIAVIDSRALTASKRHQPTETIFELLRNGLFPFGWDWDRVWCLSPSEMRDLPAA
ncbi:MAG: hypothetical protein KDA60_20880 [Planctomycetales bacterium]|nr:hypothetical protein [Planctomycetales bacterium]